MVFNIHAYNLEKLFFISKSKKFYDGRGKKE